MQKKAVIETLVGTGRCGMARACRLFVWSVRGLPEAGDPGKMVAQEGLVAETSRQHPGLGYRKVTALLRSVHGETINPERRRVKPQERARRSATRGDEVWSYDFIQDSLADCWTVRGLSIIDEYNRECVMLRAVRSSWPAGSKPG